MTEHRSVKANGLEFQCLCMGNGPLLLCLHGFPDTPHSLLPLMTKMAGNTIVIMGSMWGRGFSVSRPMCLAVGSPSLSATHPCATSWKIIEKRRTGMMTTRSDGFTGTLLRGAECARPSRDLESRPLKNSL